MNCEYRLRWATVIGNAAATSAADTTKRSTTRTRMGWDGDGDGMGMGMGMGCVKTTTAVVIQKQQQPFSFERSRKIMVANRGPMIRGTFYVPMSSEFIRIHSISILFQ